MTDLVRITAEEDAVARPAGLGDFQLTLTPADLDSELEAAVLFACGGHLEFRDAAGRLVGEIPASAITVASCRAPVYGQGLGPLGTCASNWLSANWSDPAHIHECEHTQGHALVETTAHECRCGARLPI